VLILRAYPTIQPYSAYFTALSIGFIATALADIAFGLKVGTWHAWGNRALPDSLAYLSLAYSYFHFFNMSETARRMRLMIELYLSPNGLTPRELMSRYSAEEVVEVRLGRLLSIGQIIERNGRFYKAGRSLGIPIRLILFLKWLTIGKMSNAAKARQAQHENAISGRP
jgi:hypothetical protein